MPLNLNQKDSMTSKKDMIIQKLLKENAQLFNTIKELNNKLCNNTVMFDAKKILKTDTVVCCKTELEAKLLLQWADSIGRTWCDGHYFNEITYYNEFKDKTCYNIYLGMYGSYDTYDNYINYTILSFNDALLK